MPTMPVPGGEIAYEVLGSGTSVVLTPGGWQSRETYRVLAERLSDRYRVLIYDRRNCCESSIGVTDAESEWHMWADDLHVVQSELGMTPAVVSGGSNGQTLSLMMAMTHPEDVAALILMSQETDDIWVLRVFGHSRYEYLAGLAEQYGMRGVLDAARASAVHPTWGIISSVANNMCRAEELVLSLDPGEFASTMKRWYDWFTTGRLHVANMAPDQLAAIRVPALVIPGTNALHPVHSAQEVAASLPNAEILNLSEYYSAEEMQEIESLEEVPRAGARAPLCAEFIERAVE